MVFMLAPVKNMLNKPNVILPLSPSYNERGIDGFAATVTNSLDQRKINLQYEPVKNAMTGKTTLYLTPRPGFSRSSTTIGSADQQAYLIALQPGQSAVNDAGHLVFSTKGDDLRASRGGISPFTTVIATEASLRPKYVDRTNISGTEYLVLDAGDADPTRTFYAADTDASAWTEISDSDFTGIVQTGKLEHLDGYAHAFDRGLGRIYSSNLNSLANWTATSFVTKQIQQDINVGLARHGNQILAFGASTCEVFRNAGTAVGSPLQVVPQLAARVGMGELTIAHATNYYAQLGGLMYFIGRLATGDRVESVFAYNGATFEKVSTNAIDRILASATEKYSINTVVWAGQQAIAIGLSLPSSAAQRWLMFFPEWKDWFEWTSDVFQPVNSGKLFIASAATAGDRVFEIPTTNTWIDHSTDYTREIVFNMPTDGNQLKRMAWAGVVADSQSAGASASAGVYLQMAFANNADFSFGAARQIDLRGRKKQIYRCGAFRDRAVKITHSGNVQFRIQNFIAKVL